MQKNKFYILLLIFFIITSCEPDYPSLIKDVKKQIVVDGWIENEKGPIVILTYNTPYFSNLDSSSFMDLVATRAKVVVSNDSFSEILTLTKDTNYFPPYVYKGFQIKGMEGKKYYLTVDDELGKFKATTTIPFKVTLDSIWFTFTGDSTGVIKGIISDNEKEKNYYRVFTKISKKDKRYIPTAISAYDDKYFNGKRFTFYLPLKSYEFKRGDIIGVKLTQIDSVSYQFWYAYNDEIVNAGSPFAANYKYLKGNIIGGLGIWCGYAATYYYVKAE